MLHVLDALVIKEPDANSDLLCIGIVLYIRASNNSYIFNCYVDTSVKETS